MPRYIDADELKSTLKNLPQWGGEVLLLSVLNTVDRQFTADVAPRAEVERQKVEIEALKIANEKMYSAIEETKAELAMEIFEEIEKILDDSTVVRSFDYGRPYFAISKFKTKFAALKKKYTEEVK